MSGLGETGGLPGFSMSNSQVQPRDIDRYEQYVITHPGLTATALGTTTPAAGTAAFVFDNVRLDYPRNVLLSILGVAGGMGGTATIVGKSQFGDVQSETLGFGSANGGGSVAGTKIFALLTGATVNGIAGLGGTALGTARLGYAVGTAAGLVAKFGLPVKVQSSTDLKNVSFTSQGVGGTAINGGTIGTAAVDTVNHAYVAQRIVGGSEIYNFTIKTSFDNQGKPPISGL